jgi:ABC-2 type transport system ATP-binding protein
VLGGQPAGSAAALDGIAFVGQDAPLYKNLSVRDMLHLTRNLNRNFDQQYAQSRLADLDIPLGKKAGRLSGGQQAQLALTLALARRPQLLILDEPLAMLDPLARQDFMATVLSAMTGQGMGRWAGCLCCCPRTRWPSWNGWPTTSSCSPAAGSRWPAKSMTCWPATGC